MDTARLREVGESGLSIRLVKSFDPLEDRMATRLDVLFGFAPLRSEYVAHVISTRGPALEVDYEL